MVEPIINAIVWASRTVQVYNTLYSQKIERQSRCAKQNK